ncbi:MAG: lipoate--protein ligase family protein [Gemmatimonadales bacterium]
MTTDEQLLAAAARTGARFLRLYRWDPPTLSFGRNEAVLALYDHDLIAQRRIAVVRRPTGGKAVWHEHELTYAVAAPIDTFGSLRGAYRAIHERLAEALRSLGANTALAPARPPVRPAARPTSCFASPVGGEILVDGRKLAGSAQVRRGRAFLQHGSILLDGSQQVVNAVSRQPAPDAGGTTLRAALGRTVSFDEMADAIVAAWGTGAATGTGAGGPLRPRADLASLALG